MHVQNENMLMRYKYMYEPCFFTGRHPDLDHKETLPKMAGHSTWPRYAGLSPTSLALIPLFWQRAKGEKQQIL